MLDPVLLWAARVLTACLVLGSILPFIRVGWCWVRLWDFPRLQIVALLAIPVSLIALQVARNQLWPEHAWMLAAMAGVAVWQGTHVLPFTKLSGVEVPWSGDGGGGSTIRLLISNVEVTNREYAAARAVYREHAPDVLILIEVDDDWRRELDELARSYPHRVESPRPEGLGLAVWSRFPLEKQEIRHLVSERRPSVLAVVRLPSGDRIRLAALHPTPLAFRTAPTAGGGTAGSATRSWCTSRTRFGRIRTPPGSSPATSTTSPGRTRHASSSA